MVLTTFLKIPHGVSLKEAGHLRAKLNGLDTSLARFFTHSSRFFTHKNALVHPWYREMTPPPPSVLVQIKIYIYNFKTRNNLTLKTYFKYFKLVRNQINYNRTLRNLI